MGWFSLATLTGLLLVLYAGHKLSHFYALYHPPLCGSGEEGEQCLEPLISPAAAGGQWPLLQLRVYAGAAADSLRLVHTFRHFDVAKDFEQEVTFDLPKQTRANGSLTAKVVLLPGDYEGERTPPWFVEDTVSLSAWATPAAASFSLMEDEKPDEGSEKPVTHIKSVLPVRICGEAVVFGLRNVPVEFRHMLQTLPNAGGDSRSSSLQYLPLMRIQPLSMLAKHLNQVNPHNETTTVLVTYSPLSMGKMRLFISTEASLNSLLQLHLTVDDLDEIKRVLAETSPLLLAVAILVCALHLCFDASALNSDSAFWRSKKSEEALVSTKTLAWRCVASTIVLAYLAEHTTPLLVLLPLGLTALGEYWKLAKALKVSLSSSRGDYRRLGKQSQKEAETDSINSQAMYYLSALLVPLCVGGAAYSLLYMPHRSWRSWLLETVANGVYAFGFLFMLPQLFVNYKLKSVAHLPWRAFMYKAFNTFIDDLYACIFTMPTPHRMACLRDDIAFFVYLYQRWLYPVDKTRVNEFGEDFVEEEKPAAKTD